MLPAGSLPPPLPPHSGIEVSLTKKGKQKNKKTELPRPQSLRGPHREVAREDGVMGSNSPLRGISAWRPPFPLAQAELIDRPSSMRMLSPTRANKVLMGNGGERSFERTSACSRSCPRGHGAHQRSCLKEDGLLGPRNVRFHGNVDRVTVTYSIQHGPCSRPSWLVPTLWEDQRVGPPEVGGIPREFPWGHGGPSARALAGLSVSCGFLPRATCWRFESAAKLQAFHRDVHLGKQPNS